ncbi:MAG: hypothetical protein M1817_003286 [Caeruleum heppii]|nr:MAG: hypothetical protein M1817_003286 [Caeruleum heppii]
MTQGSRRSSVSSNSRGRGGRSSPMTGRHERRQSAVLMHLNLQDPALPGPGELQSNDPRANSLRTTSPPNLGISPTADPHHQRAPSLGELHQELEQEQEAQVNRLLQTIRQQELQLRQMQQATGQAAGDSAAAEADDSTPTSERSFSFPAVAQTAATVTNPRPRSPAPPGLSRQPLSSELSRRSSRRSMTPSRTVSPSLRPISTGLSPHGEGHEQGWLLGGGRNEAEFYQAEAQNLTRENQILRVRIRELERQVADLSHSANTSAPATVSNLTAPPLSQEDVGTSSDGRAAPPTSQAPATASVEAKT